MTSQAATLPTDCGGFTTAILYIFSWVMLLPIAVISSGVFLAQFIRLEANPENTFGIPIPFFNIVAKGPAVILGLTAYILMVMAVAFLLGPDRAADIITERFGIAPPDRFTALCLLSSLWALAGSCLCYLCYFIRTMRKSSPATPQSAERDAIIRALIDKRLGEEQTDE